MRIALIYDRLYPYTKGGAEKVIREVSVRLGQRHEVHVFCGKYWDGPQCLDIAAGVVAHGVCRQSSGSHAGDDTEHTLMQTLFFSFRLPAALLRHGPFDVIDCVSIPYIPLFCAKLVSALTRKPLVSLWLEVWGDEHWRRHLGAARGKVGAMIEKLAARLPSHFLSISEHTREGLLSLEVPEERISVVTPGIDWEGIQDAESGHSFADIVFVGRLIKDKGVAMLLEAVARVKESFPCIRCRIIGNGPERDSLQKARDSLRLSTRVEFVDVVDNVYPEMKAASMLVHPSHREGFGIVPVEAAACGIPVITIDAPNNASKDFVREGKCGIVCAPDADSLADSILALLQDDVGREEYGRRGRVWSRAYDWSRMVRQIELVYETVAERKHVQS